MSLQTHLLLVNSCSLRLITAPFSIPLVISYRFFTKLQQTSKKQPTPFRFQEILLSPLKTRAICASTSPILYHSLKNIVDRNFIWRCSYCRGSNFPKASEGPCTIFFIYLGLFLLALGFPFVIFCSSELPYRKQPPSQPLSIQTLSLTLATTYPVQHQCGLPKWPPA